MILKKSTTAKPIVRPAPQKIVQIVDPRHNCPNCGATKLIIDECEYCGSNKAKNKKHNILRMPLLPADRIIK